MLWVINGTRFPVFKMNNTLEEVANNMCKNHTGRSDKDFCRVCPSKLSKRELEDMYFALVENNMDLKKTVNGQREQIKLLNTKVQRLMAQRPTTNRELKECCINNRAIINEQKEVIADLKKNNDRLTERIRLLNMRLCSAKQFLKKGQTPNSARCSKCCNAASFKNSSTTALLIERNEPSVKSANVSSQYLSNVPAPDTLQTLGLPIIEKVADPANPNGVCDQNKCRTEMDELKQKTIALHEELSQTHDEYASRIKKLEEEMVRLNAENARARSDSTCSERRLQQQKLEISELLQRLRKCEAQCEHLTVQLKIEKSRAAELEMRSKANDMSSAIAAAVDQHLANFNLKKEEQETRREESTLSLDNSSMYHCQFQLIVPNNSISSQTDKGSEASAEKIINLASDDSGYTDGSRVSEESPKDVKAMNKITDLQEQLDHFKQNLGQNCDAEFRDTRIQRRKSCLERPSCSKSNIKNPPVPGDIDFLIRTNRLNSFKNTNEWCNEYDRSDADSSICDNNSSKAEDSGPRDKGERRNGESASNNVTSRIDAVPRLDLSDIESNEGNRTYRKEEMADGRDGSAGESNESFHFAKETITKVDGKLVSGSFQEDKGASAIEVLVDGSCQKLSNNLMDGSSVMKKEASSDIIQSGEEHRLVSTGVDPMKEIFEDAAVREEEADPLAGKHRLEICEHSVRVCACPEAVRGGTPMLRSCSGTLRFTTTPTSTRFRRCRCWDGASRQLEGVQDRDSVVRTSARGTSVLHGEAPLDVMSPDTTRCEISSFTDLPSDREGLSARTSPGEDKATYTQSEETPRSTTDYGSLSEGEVLTSGRKQSIGEAPYSLNSRRGEATQDKMEDTLKAISEELSRCRHLLQMQSSRESSRIRCMPQDASCMTEQNPSNSKSNQNRITGNRNMDSRNRDPDNRNGFIPTNDLLVRKSGLVLRKCDANERVGGATPKCVFTLHVGTVILSDQAVVYSRGKSLGLTWRFFDQPPSMTHQLAGRVMHFDFSLEYDIRLTQNFLDYLNHEEMPIIVSEIDKKDQPFASCHLPLRDALLHTNRRVDMSLALIAGPGVKGKDASMNSLTMAEELGVLDVWCMLRVPPGVIDDVISQTIASFHHHPSSVERIIDDDRTDFHLDQDLNLRRTSKTLTESKYSYDSENIYDIMNSKKWRRSSAVKRTDAMHKKSVTLLPKEPRRQTSSMKSDYIGKLSDDNNTLDITILWLALNEECRAMNDPRVKRIYVAFAFLGKAGADMETPTSLPKPRNFMDKCHFNFRRSFAINECDVVVVGQMARRRHASASSPDPKDCIVFSVISEPPEDPLGLESCEDIGYAYLYLGDALSSNSNSYTEVLPVRTPDEALVCGRLAVRVDGLAVVRSCVERTRPSS